MGKPLRCLSFGVQRQNEEAAGGAEMEAYQNGSHSHSHSKKNPFSTLGLDKFSSLLTDLQEKRRKIYEQMPSLQSRDDPYISFIYSNTGYWVPIVVKLRDHKHKHTLHKQKKHNKAAASHDGGQLTTQEQAAAPGNNHPAHTPIKNNKRPKNSSKASNSTVKAIVRFQQQQPPASSGDVRNKVHKKNSEISDRNGYNKQMRLERCRPSQYLPIFLVLCLLCLAIFGRSVAILLASAWWYLIPSLKTPANPITPKPKRSSILKKDYARSISFS